MDKCNNLTNIYIPISKYWQPYTGAVDMRNWTRKHPLKDVIHCCSHMHTATEARRGSATTHYISWLTEVEVIWFSQYIPYDWTTYLSIYIHWNLFYIRNIRIRISLHLIYSTCIDILYTILILYKYIIFITKRSLFSIFSLKGIFYSLIVVSG